MHQKRILARIRSHHSTSRKARGKPNLVQRLHKARSLMEPAEASSQTHMDCLIETVKVSFDRLEDLSTSQVLDPSSIPVFVELLKSVSNFQDSQAHKIALIPSITSFTPFPRTLAFRARNSNCSPSFYHNNSNNATQQS